MGHLSNKLPRKQTLLILGSSWTILTFIQSFVSAFWLLLILRTIMIVCMSSITPFCFSLLNDSFPEEYKARSIAVYQFGLYLGVALSNLSLEMCGAMGWRWAFRVVCALSIIPTLLFIIIKEPQWGAFTDHSDRTFTVKENLKHIFTNKIMIVLFIASSFWFLGEYTLGYWAVWYFSFQYPES